MMYNVNIYIYSKYKYCSNFEIDIYLQLVKGFYYIGVLFMFWLGFKFMICGINFFSSKWLFGQIYIIIFIYRD